MKVINNKFLIAVLFVALASTGCKKDYLDVNKDPNRVTDDNITAELIFPLAAHNIGIRSYGSRFIDNWMGYWAVSGDWALDQTETSYNIDFNFGDGVWRSNYHVLFDLNQTQVKAMAEKDTALAGAAMILSAKLWQETVDLFGNIPYTQAFHNDLYTQPSYDKATDIYPLLQKKLDSAISYMKTNPTNGFITADIVNGGSETQWIKFANTLKLRLLIRQSEVPGFNPSSEIAKIQANGGLLMAGDNIVVNPGYTNSAGKQSPFYASYGLTPTGTEANTIARANAYFVNLLSSTNDPRLSRYFKVPSSGGSITGDIYGTSSGNPDGSHSSNIGPGLANSAAQSQWIFPAFESLFLQAEAVARGWMPGNAQAIYESAVTESFVWLGVPNASTAANNYLTNTSIANWSNAGSTPASQAKFIAFQKYIALCGIDPQEAWSDLRRLNMMPDNGYISVNPSKISNTLPVRLLYAQSEYTTNSANVKAQGSINAFTSKLFWQP